MSCQMFAVILFCLSSSTLGFFSHFCVLFLSFCDDLVLIASCKGFRMWLYVFLYSWWTNKRNLSSFGPMFCLQHSLASFFFLLYQFASVVQGKSSFKLEFTCQFCYQAPDYYHICTGNSFAIILNSWNCCCSRFFHVSIIDRSCVPGSRQMYVANCTVPDTFFCLGMYPSVFFLALFSVEASFFVSCWAGPRVFHKQVNCSVFTKKSYSTTLALRFVNLFMWMHSVVYLYWLMCCFFKSASCLEVLLLIVSIWVTLVGPCSNCFHLGVLVYGQL